ncbi:diguanylate cyclase [Deinococcus sp. JMULE3]|uniref:GGDEF domain-containing protein n=1 Tax=Deinococcus sp. JMULE3 TaxID=2518341 RepID=UPI001576E476|nr:sensor domain-containing diguanylate cyclase [Deinococcus sp. JMULE3]
MPTVRIPPGSPEAQYRRAGLMIVMTCLLLTSVVTLLLSGPLEVQRTDRLLLGLLVVKNAAYLLWLWRAPQQFQLVGALELGGEILAALYRMHDVLLLDHTAHGLSGYSYWLALPYLVASLTFPAGAALAAVTPYLLGLGVLGAAYWQADAVPDVLRQDNTNAWLQMLLMHTTFMAVITLQQQLRRRYAHAVALAERKSAQALLDPLTGLPGRRALHDLLDGPHADLSVVYFDLDHFKRVNDTYGHDVGDDVLRHVARGARASVRAGDRVGRWGGEEFLILVRGDAGVAAQIAGRLREHLRAHPHPVAGAVTISCGVAQRRPGEDTASALRRADQALYAAKRAGRDTIELAPPDAA